MMKIEVPQTWQSQGFNAWIEKIHNHVKDSKWT